MAAFVVTLESKARLTALSSVAMIALKIADQRATFGPLFLPLLKIKAIW
jgi:hypothetical protein